MLHRIQLFILCLMPLVAEAHPLHEPGVHYGLMHYLSEPYHLGTLALLGLSGVIAWRWARRGRLKTEDKS